jgi:uncharacterized phage-associated protein
MRNYRPIELANTFISKYGAANNIEHMKLQKLLFYAYGWWLVNNDDPVLSSKPEVWRYGPVFSSVYWQFNKYKSNPIRATETETPFEASPPEILRSDDATMRFIEWIWGKYGGFSGLELSDMTHRPGTPWHTVATRYNYKVPNNLEIDDEITKSYFCGLARTGSLA